MENHLVKYVSSYSFEWNEWSKVLDGIETERNFARFNMDRNDFAGLRVLDAGCGSGRFLSFFQEARMIVGVDLSSSVILAHARRCHQNLNIMQADILNLPLRNASFDFVFSFGVLMATPDTKKAFMSIARLVKPGGKLAVFIYNNRATSGLWCHKTKEGLSYFCRRITVRLPHRILYWISHLAIPLYSLKHLPKIGRFIDATFESGDYRDWHLRVLGTFDWYSSKYQWVHTNSEVMAWFKEAGFRNLYMSPSPINIVGIKL